MVGFIPLLGSEITPLLSVYGPDTNFLSLLSTVDPSLEQIQKQSYGKMLMDSSFEQMDSSTFRISEMILFVFPCKYNDTQKEGV